MAQTPPVLAMAEVAQLLGVSVSRVRQLMNDAAFPEPIAALSVGRIWSTEAVVAWAAGAGAHAARHP